MALSVNALLDEAVDFLGDNKPLHAIQILRKVISKNSDCTDAYLKLAEIYVGMNNYNAAEELLLDGLRKLSEDYKLVYALGSLYYNLGELERALPLLRKLNSWRNPSVHLALATIFLEQNEFLEAIAEVRRVLRGDAKYPDANGILGRIYLKQKNFPNAIKYLRRELALNESSVEFRLDLATAFYMLGDLRTALEEFTLLIDTDPDFFPGWLMCGKILLELGKADESEFYLQRAMNLNPKNAELLQTLANLYNAFGEVEKARAIFDELAATNAVVEDDTDTLENFSATRNCSRRDPNWHNSAGAKTARKRRRR
ncbi:MAG TPA: tetratricopeptide repeat protein [Candidatus Acidoferrales bacterium]|nr:tetratricopeptide repeat protein [Candidatus Acidoferrales bacterium]